MALASEKGGEGLFEVVQMTTIATVDMTHDNRLRVGVPGKSKVKKPLRDALCCRHWPSHRLDLVYALRTSPCERSGDSGPVRGG